MPDNPLDEIELATAVLTRNFELLRRRSDVYTDLDRAEYLLLRTLEDLGPVGISALAAALGVDASTAGRQLTAMQAKGLVERTPAPTDRRCTIISPTDEGRRRMTATRTRRRKNTEALLADWTEEDMHAFADMLTRYNRAVTAQYIEPGEAKP